MMAIVYVTIGNSDDKLTQERWAAFVQHVRDFTNGVANVVHGEWFSLPNARRQNMCICIETNMNGVVDLRHGLSLCAQVYKQESIAMAVVENTIFCRPPTPNEDGDTL